MMRFSFSGFRRGVSSATVLLVVTVGVAASAFAQTPLAEVAKKEAERRKTQPASGKVYTNKDLPESAQKPATPPATETAQPVDPVAAAAAQPPAGPEEQKPQTEQKDEAWWKGRIMQAREELRRQIRQILEIARIDERTKVVRL